jgi:alpha-mannosidase
MKPAENGDGVIVRCYEALNRRGSVEVSATGAGAVVETNLMEEDEDGAAGESGSVRFEVKPFEIRTFRALRA